LIKNDNYLNLTPVVQLRYSCINIFVGADVYRFSGSSTQLHFSSAISNLQLQLLFSLSLVSSGTAMVLKDMCFFNKVLLRGPHLIKSFVLSAVSNNVLLFLATLPSYHHASVFDLFPFSKLFKHAGTASYLICPSSHFCFKFIAFTLIKPGKEKNECFELPLHVSI